MLKNKRPDLFWKMVEHEMKHSVAFRVSALNSVHKGWYKNEDLKRVIKICIGVDNIIKNSVAELRYFRVEIPKGNPEEIAKFFAENPDKA